MPRADIQQLQNALQFLDYKTIDITHDTFGGIDATIYLLSNTTDNSQTICVKMQDRLYTRGWNEQSYRHNVANDIHFQHDFYGCKFKLRSHSEIFTSELCTNGNYIKKSRNYDHHIDRLPEYSLKNYSLVQPMYDAFRKVRGSVEYAGLSNYCNQRFKITLESSSVSDEIEKIELPAVIFKLINVNISDVIFTRGKMTHIRRFVIDDMQPTETFQESRSENELLTKIAELETSIGNHITTERNLQDRITALTDTANDLHRRLYNMSGRVEGLLTQVDGIKQQNKGLDQENDSLRKQIMELKSKDKT